MHIGGGAVRESTEELLEQGVGEMGLGEGCWGAEVDEGTPAEIDHGAGEGFVHWHVGMAIASDPFSIAEGFGEGLSEGDAGVLDGVMEIDLNIPSCVDLEVGQAVFCEEREHVIQEGDSGVHG